MGGGGGGNGKKKTEKTEIYVLREKGAEKEKSMSKLI